MARILVLVFCCTLCLLGHVHCENVAPQVQQNGKDPVIMAENHKINNTANITSSNNASISVNNNNDSALFNNNNNTFKRGDDLPPGAFQRGVIVFMVMGLLFFCYVGYKTWRRKTSRNTVISKYGVRSRRSDLEMTPLPLDEEDEDEIVFDLKRNELH